jgi:hypothetical protein
MQFGAMSVTVKLLSVALFLIVLAAVVLGVVFLIRKFWPTLTRADRLRRLP